ncbi:glycosyltransferase [Oceanicola sp. 502str15]|uniref:glycosyltransferase n=1 Tax=Oceanicola sp. 502str15 TaxID=2696061 RepID=UPI002094F6C2|nr:glycosyltransferase [Oceanicola sp. 502str15]MCO6381955.1 glycosyltransferase [Oceanicola sp. 502str15]
MKICLVAQTFAPQKEGGAEISSRHTAENLSQRHEVVVLSLGRAGQAGAAPGPCASGGPYRLHRLRYRNSYLPEVGKAPAGRLARALWHLRNGLGAIDRAELAAFLTAERFDLIYAQNSAALQPALYRVARELGVPVCQHLRDYALLCPRTSMHRTGKNCATPCLGCRVLTARKRRAARSVGTTIAVSDFVRRRFAGSGVFAQAEAHVLHNTNTNRALPTVPTRRADSPPGCFTFGYLGALSPEKGLEVLLAAFAALPARLPPWVAPRLLIGGQGSAGYVAGLKARSAAGAVEWLGQVAPDEVFGRADAMVVPSLWHEPQSRVLIEAAVRGLPTLAAGTGGTTEVVRDQRLGWCYEADRPEALTALMARAARNGPEAFRESLATAFPGLVGFKGTAEETGFYPALETILQAAAAAQARP